MRKILFSYREQNMGLTCIGSDDGDEVVIFQGGALEYRHFLTGQKAPVAVDSYPANSNLADNLQKVLEKNRSALEQLPVRVENHSCDGTWETFRFLGKEVTVDNLDFSVEIAPMLKAESAEEQELLAQNWILAKVRSDVTAVLKKYQLPLLMEYPYRGMERLPVTYGKLSREICQQFSAAGIEAAKLETDELIRFAAGFSRNVLWQKRSDFVSPETEDRVRELADRHLAGEPVPYLIGEWEFYGLSLDITPEVLIPRPDTEVLAEQAINFCRTLEHPRILDLCAGSGCIGLALASQIPQAAVVLGEWYDGPLSICHRNVQRCNLADRVSVQRMDTLGTPPDNLGRFQCVTCNPPYIPTGDLSGLERSVRDYEPHTALDGGSDGLDFYRAIAEKWKPVLSFGGRLYLEVGIYQAKPVRTILERYGFQEIQITPDLSGIERVVSGTNRERV